MSDAWLPLLKTDTPQSGFELAVKLSRMGVKVTQPSDQVRSHLRAAYKQDSAQLIASSHVIAVTFKRSRRPTIIGARATADQLQFKPRSSSWNGKGRCA